MRAAAPFRKRIFSYKLFFLSGEQRLPFFLSCRAYAEVQRTFTQMLQNAKPSLQRRGIIERPYLPKKDSDTGDSGDDPLEL